jgi:hypothetical protein
MTQRKIKTHRYIDRYFTASVQKPEILIYTTKNTTNKCIYSQVNILYY